MTLPDTLRLGRLRAAFAHEPLAILPDAVAAIAASVRTMDLTGIASGDLLAEPPAERLDAYYAARGGTRNGTVAVVPVVGPIVKRDSLFSLLEGGTSTTRLTAQLRALAADESVATILLNVDSPGGTVSGLPELAAEIRRTAQTKRVVAIANDLAASAAYWIAAQADELVATPEALVGSVGVFTQHVDCSALNEQQGVKVTYIHAGRYKVEGNPDEPLTDEARAYIQSIVDDMYGMFVSDVSKGRSAALGTSVTPAMVRAEYGEGRVLTAKDAKAAGMIDRVETYSQAVARLSGVKPAGARAEGGPIAQGTAYIVGEQGPETFMVSDETDETPTDEGSVPSVPVADHRDDIRRARFALNS